MNKADCKTCINRILRPYANEQSYRGICAYDMRWASTAGGSAPEDLQDVYWCKDYEEERE